MASEVGFDHRRMAAHRLRIALGDDAAVIQYADAVAQSHHQLDVVLDEQNGFSVVADARQQRL